ncbi:D-alanyl-D-alanine carboxypeptidase/D-alanyl-D-alanine endopeptidase [Psychrobacter aestuarii]|uniref:D-alanyl-D-alanine carboxypeptidase n=1 Tax=Psychrobacter aestuarii TaxID=556327 RepID=A0ABP3FAD9_9GAMM|nr:D-alanyl-D-alanine carboxypeptidase/D-alanyl-D-alanine-endopeptidase [Psychrobacter aestuarii]
MRLLWKWGVAVPLGVSLCVCQTAAAALPESLTQALNKAQLRTDDISIVVMPVGNNSVSRLPEVVTVVDKPLADTTATNDDSSAANTPAPTDSANQNSEATLKGSTPDLTDGVSISTTRVVRKAAIEAHEKRIHKKTDDPYTYQSLEDIAPPLPQLPSDSRLPAVPMALDLDTPAALLLHNADTLRTPASTMKLVPTFIALDTLGADFVWHTRVYHTGVQVGDTLIGDLIIQGSGDPKMTHERVSQLLYQVQQRGIRHINGNIVVDSSVFDAVSKDPAAFDREPLRPYNASPDGFLVNFSSMAIHSWPQTDKTAALTYAPYLADYQLPSTIETRDAWCSSARYSLEPEWQPTKLSLHAKLPEQCGEHIFYVAYPDAKDFAARVIADKWQALGNDLTGKVIAQEQPHQRPHGSHTLADIAPSVLPLVSYPSQPLATQIFDINHFSNNVMAEQVALSIGAYSLPDTQKSTGSSLYAVDDPVSTYPIMLGDIHSWWHTHLTTAPPHLTDGSGLCRDCTVSAANLSELLGYAYHHPQFAAYVDSLGIAGVSGTIAAHGERLPDSAAIGRAWIKTGTLNNVTSMAGYVQGQSGQAYTVVGIINTEHALNTYAARVVLDQLLDWTAQQ